MLRIKKHPVPGFWNLAIPLAISGISAIAGALGNRKKTIEQTQNTSSEQHQNQYGYNTTNYDLKDTSGLAPDELPIRDAILKALTDVVGQDVDLTGYKNAGIRNINQASDLQKQLLQSQLAARGLQFSPMAATSEAGIDTGRIGNILNLVNQIPLLQQDRALSNLGGLATIFSNLATRQSSKTGTQKNDFQTVTDNWGKGTSTGTTTDPGNVLGGLFGGLGAGLAGMYGSGAFGPVSPMASLSNPFGSRQLTPGYSFNDLSQILAKTYGAMPYGVK